MADISSLSLLSQAQTAQTRGAAGIAVLRQDLQADRQIVGLIEESVQASDRALQAALTGRGGQVDILA